MLSDDLEAEPVEAGERGQQVRGAVAVAARGVRMGRVSISRSVVNPAVPIPVSVQPRRSIVWLGWSRGGLCRMPRMRR